MKFQLQDGAKVLRGKVLVNLEFGFSTDPEEAEENGERFAPLPAKITNTYIGTSETREDAGIWLELEGLEEAIFVYSNEIISYEGTA